MKKLIPLFIVFLIFGCATKTKMPDFATDNEQKLDEYSNKALNEADSLLDSLLQTPILNTEK